MTSTVRDIAKFSKALGDNADGVDKMMRGIGQAAERIGPLAERLDSVSRQIGEALTALDKDKVSAILADVQRFTGALGGSSGDVAKAMKDVASITEKLNKAADQVEGVLKGAQAFLGSAAGGEGAGAFGEIGEAAKTIRRLAENLDKRTAELSTNLNRFAGPACATSNRSRLTGGAPSPTSTARCATSSATRSSSSSGPGPPCLSTTPDDDTAGHASPFPVSWRARRCVARRCCARLYHGGVCSGGSSARVFDLSAPRDVGRLSSGSRAALIVAEPTTVQALDSERIIVRDGAGALSVLPGVQWADRLPKLVQTRLIQTFENGSRLGAVGRPGERILPDWQLNLDIRAFAIDAASGEAVVEISAKLIRDRTGRVAGARLFTARVAAGGIAGDSAAQALDAALSQVLVEIVRWARV